MLLYIPYNAFLAKPGLTKHLLWMIRFIHFLFVPDDQTRCYLNLRIQFLLSALYFQSEMCGVFPSAYQNMTSAFYVLTSVLSIVPNLHCSSMIIFTSSWVVFQAQSHTQSHMHRVVPGGLLPWLLSYLWGFKDFPRCQKIYSANTF